MNIALINVSQELSIDGTRLISSLLKQAGHSVRMIFFPRLVSAAPYEEKEIGLLSNLLKDVDLVMIGVYTVYSYRAVRVTEYVHKHLPGLKVI